jgi:transposase
MRISVMAAPGKYPEELRERAVDARYDPAVPTGRWSGSAGGWAIIPRRYATGVTEVGIDRGHPPGTSTDGATRPAAL